MRTWLANIGLLIGSISIFLLVVESGLRVTGLQTVKPNPPLIYQNSADPRIGYELRPNLQNEAAFKARVTTDEHGFREHGETYDLPLIAVLGDSIAFGYGVQDDESLPALLDRAMPEYAFLNAAVPGYTLAQEAAVYETKLRPRATMGVMLVFYWNDLEFSEPGSLDSQNILRPPGWTPADDVCRPIETGILGYVPGRCWLDTHSALYIAAKRYINLQHSKRGMQEARSAQDAGNGNDPATPEQLERYAREFAAFAELIPENEKRIFVIWPDEHLHSESRPRLRAIAESNGFTVIDLYALFGNSARTLDWDTVHPHPETIEQAAHFIAEQLRAAE